MRSATVIVEPLQLDAAGLTAQIQRSFAPLGLPDQFNAAQAVLIKPNLTYSRYKEGVTTRMEFVAALVEALRQLNSTTTIYVAEGEGGYDAYSVHNTLRTMGFYELESRFPRVRVVNLSEGPRTTARLETRRGPYDLQLPALFSEVDFSISCPLPKVHAMTRITLSMKNMWGCLPDTLRLKNHYMLDHILSRLVQALKFRFAFLDGRYGLTSNGPMEGDTVEPNWFAASNSLGAFDLVLAEMMGMSPRRVSHLRWARRYGVVPPRESITVIGSPRELAMRFRLHRSFWNYVALSGFRSSILTKLFYLSKVSDLLHRMMYSIRKRPEE